MRVFRRSRRDRAKMPQDRDGAECGRDRTRSSTPRRCSATSRQGKPGRSRLVRKRGITGRAPNRRLRRCQGRRDLLAKRPLPEILRMRGHQHRHRGDHDRTCRNRNIPEDGRIRAADLGRWVLARQGNAKGQVCRAFHRQCRGRARAGAGADRKAMRSRRVRPCRA